MFRFLNHYLAFKCLCRRESLKGLGFDFDELDWVRFRTQRAGSRPCVFFCIKKFDLVYQCDSFIMNRYTANIPLNKLVCHLRVLELELIVLPAACKALMLGRSCSKGVCSQSSSTLHLHSCRECPPSSPRGTIQHRRARHRPNSSLQARARRGGSRCCSRPHLVQWGWRRRLRRRQERRWR